MHPADTVSRNGKTCLISDTMWYDREFIACRITELGVLWVHGLLVMPPVGDIRYSQCTANPHRIGVVIITIRINLLPVLCDFRRRIEIQPWGCQLESYLITMSGHCISHIFMRYVSFIIAGEFICFRRSSIRSRRHCGGEEIVAW